MGYLVVSSPVGDLTVFEEKGAIVALEFGRAGESPRANEKRAGESPRANEKRAVPPVGRRTSAVLTRAARQLDEYFAGRRKKFDLPLTPAGTPFQRRVWARLSAIPYGGIETYGAIARKLRSGPRAVGGACGANPIPILIPCHRVLGAGGALGGYSGAGGTATKRFLLAGEAPAAP